MADQTAPAALTEYNETVRMLDSDINWNRTKLAEELDWLQRRLAEVRRNLDQIDANPDYFSEDLNITGAAGSVQARTAKLHVLIQTRKNIVGVHDWFTGRDA